MPWSKEQQREYNRIWSENNREKKREYQRIYRENNKEKVIESRRKYSENNLEKERESYRKYRETPRGIKSSRINNWKRYGIKCEDWNELYDYYSLSTNCEYCWKELREGKGFNNKHLDHDHTTGQVRGVLCGACNVKDVFA